MQFVTGLVFASVRGKFVLDTADDGFEKTVLLFGCGVVAAESGDGFF